MSLSEYLAAGPQRREQLTAEVYEIYRQFGFDPKPHKPEFVQERLTTRPATAWQVTIWSPLIRPEDRTSRILSDGAVFRTRATALIYGYVVEQAGGAVQSITPVENPKCWYETLAHFRRLGSMTLVELEALKNHWRSLVEADEQKRKVSDELQIDGDSAERFDRAGDSRAGDR